MTPKQLSALPLGTHPIKQHPGLRLEVRASKRTWTLRRRDMEGKLKQAVLGHWPDLSLAGAIAACEEARRTTPKAVGAMPSALTVRAAVQLYCVEHIRRQRANWRHSEALIWRHVGELADRDTGAIGRADAHRFLTGFSDRPAVQRVLKMELSACWEYAMMAGALPDGANPWLKLKVAPPGRKDRVLSDGEASQLVSWLRIAGSVPEIVRDVLLLTLGTGARSGEVCEMKCAAVDLTAGTWTLGKTKNGLGRVIYLNEFALAVLRGRDLTGEHAFELRRQQWIANVVNRAIAGARCPVKGWTPHDLRRTMRTGLARLGVSHEVAELCLGHRLGGVAGIYNLYGYAEEQRAALEKWGSHLSQLVTRN